MATSSSNKLVEEINDQFLICKICYDVYRQPKTLSCLHTFCSECLERHQEAELERSYRYLLYSRAITCPICRKKTDLPVGGVKRLPDNFLVANLADIVNRRRGTDKVQRCEICKSDDGSRPNVAVAKCLDCSKLLCRSCLELHKRTKVTQSHGLFDIEVEKDIVCKVHQDEVVRFYCELCEVCVCVVCTFQEHKGHEVSSFTEGIEKYRHSLDSLLIKCRQRIGQLKEQLRMINKCETDLKQTEERITEVAIESISVIRKKEREMVRDLYLAFGEESIDFIKEKEFIQESIESLQTTCNLTDMILKDRSVELLLLKKEIQQKLNLLLQRKWIQPPDIVTQHVQFVPGRAELGYLKIGDTSSDVSDGVPEVDSNKSSEVSRVRSGVGRAVNTQTPFVQTNDSSTSMGVSVLDLGHERVTQTEAIFRKEAGTLTYPDQGKPVMVTACTLAVPDTKDIQTMTIGTPTMKRKIQTEKVTHADRETNTVREPTQLNHVSINTQTVDTTERSTMTKIRRLHDQVTCTDQLITTRDREMLTVDVMKRTCATETVLPDTHNRGTLTTRPSTCDKKISTTRVVLRTQDTNTPQVMSCDSAVTAKVYGHDVGVTTRTTVTTNTGTGDNDVTIMETYRAATPKSTSDKQTSCQVTCTDSSDMTDVTGTTDQNTFTSYFNMADKVTSTDHVSCRSADTNTDVVAHEHKAVHVDNIDEKVKVEMLDDVCQTMISMIDAVLWPSMMPVHVGTSTELTEVIDQVTSTDRVILGTTGINTDFRSTSDVGIGDASCATSDMASDAMSYDATTLEAYTETEVTSTEDTASCTIPAYTAEFGTSTDKIPTKDSSHDTFPGYLADAETNTNLDVIVKSVVPLTSTSTNTSTVLKVDNATSVIVPTKDTQIETIQIPYDDSSTNTEAPALSESATSMGGLVSTKNTYVNTIRIDMTSTGSGSAGVCIADTASATDRPAVMSVHTETDPRPVYTQQTETDILDTRDVSVSGQVEVMVRGTDAMLTEVTSRQTFTEPVLQNTIGVGTISVQSSTKGVATEPPQVREYGTYTYVQNVEKATYMPQAITITTGTSTKPMFTSEKSLCTDPVQEDDRSTNTVPARLSTQETTMYSEVATRDMRTNTDSVRMVDCQSDPIVLSRDTKYTNTVHVELCSTGVGTPEVFTLSAGTTTYHRVTYTDQDTTTVSQETRDQMTDTVQPETRHQQVDVKPESKSVGVLKRPHTISRGAGSPYVTLCTTSTSPNLPYVADQGTMVQVDTENRSTSGVPYDVVDRGTGTLVPQQVEHFTEMTPVLVEQRGCSPIRDMYADRGCSPVCVQISCERETSPVTWPVSDKATAVSPQSVDSYTSTVHIDQRSQSTGMPHVYLTDRASSPVDVTPEILTVHRGTSMPQIVQKDVASAAEPDTEAVGVNTITRSRVERASTPIRIAIHEQAISAIVSTDDKEAGTPHVSTSEKGTWKRPITSHSSTSMPQISYLEKETCTPRVHILHKNTCTENMTMADKQTNTISDITSAYRQMVRGGDKPLMVTRGTTMAQSVIPTNKEISPPSSESTTVERAISPIRSIMVDKSVSVKKGEILEPVDTYQSAGHSKKQRKARPRPRLASIEEDSSESSVESLEDENMRMMSPLLYPPLTPVNRRVPRPKMSIAGILHKERFLPSTPRMGKNAVSAFSSESRSTSSLIVCKVDVATNTKDVATETRGTSTDRELTSDKGVLTEFLPMEGRMAECISKLKTVRNRLEQKQQASQAAEESGWNLSTVQRPTRCPTLGITMRSKSLGDSLNEQEIPLLSQSPLNTSGSSDGGSSHGDSDEKVAGSRQKARKQRLDINQLLRSSSLPERDSSPPLSPPPAARAPTPMLMPKPKIRTVYPQVIPKLNIDDFKLKTSKEISKKSSRVAISSARKPSPKRRSSSQGNESRRQKDKNVPTTAAAPPEPPKRSSSLKHALLAGRTSEGSSPARKDDGFHQK